MAKTRNKRRRNKNKTPKRKRSSCGFRLFGGEAVPAPAIVPSVQAQAFPGGAQNAGEAAMHMQQEQNERQNDSNNKFPQNGGTASTRMIVPQASTNGMQPGGGTSGNQNATNGVEHLVTGHANAQFDNCVGEPPSCGESQRGGSIVTKIYPTVSCFSGGVKTRKTNRKRKRKRKRKITGKKSKKSHKKRQTRRHKRKHKSKKHKKRN